MDIQKLYDTELGFSKVIEEIMTTGRKKPIIGHNPIYDMGFLYRQFLSPTGDLPENYLEFISEWKRCFPTHDIYDTKVLAQSCGTHIFGKTDLKTIEEVIKKEKRLRNNMTFEFDLASSPNFGLYEEQSSR